MLAPVTFAWHLPHILPLSWTLFFLLSLASYLDVRTRPAAMDREFLTHESERITRRRGACHMCRQKKVRCKCLSALDHFAPRHASPYRHRQWRCPMRPVPGRSICCNTRPSMVLRRRINRNQGAIAATRQRRLSRHQFPIHHEYLTRISMHIQLLLLTWVT